MKEINLASVLASKRREKGLTQEEIAEYFGVSKQSVSKWETGSSYPDILLLPRLASYFNISVDELIDYQPQMTVDDIRKLNIELKNAFASKPFDEVMNRCREIVKKYFSCFPLLYQIGSLFMNYGSVCNSEQKISVLTEAKELFVRVKTQSESDELRHLALYAEAYCETELCNFSGVAELLENEIRYAPQPSIQAVLSKAYQMLGKTRDAKAVLQDSIVKNIITLFHDMPVYLSVCTDDAKHFEEICGRTMMMIEIFNAKKLSPLSLLPFYINAAEGWITLGNTEKAVEMIEACAEIATGDIPPSLVSNDDFFTLVSEFRDKQLKERPFGMPELPFDEQSLKQKIADLIINHPAFSALHENQRYKKTVKKLKKGG